VTTHWGNSTIVKTTPDVFYKERLAVEGFLRTRAETDFLAIYDRHSRAMYALARHLLGARRQAAADVLQESWLRAVAKLPDFQWQSSLRTWLCGLVVNCCRERFREPIFEELPDSDSAGSHPEDGLDLQAALDRLAPGYRAVVVLHDVHGHTHAEIAGMLGVDEGTSKSQLFRARRLLRATLRPESARKDVP